MAAAFCFKSFNRAPLGEASTGSISGDGDARACAHYGYFHPIYTSGCVCVYAIWCLEKLVGYSTGVLRRSNFYQSPLFFESFFMVDAHGPCFFWLQVMNYICSLFFLVELILRMIAWLGDPDNFIDLSTKWDWRKPLLSCVFVCTLIFIFFNFPCTQVLKIDKHHASHGKTPTRLWSISFWGIGLNSSRGLGVEAWKSSGVLPVAVFPVLVDLAPKTMRPKKSCIFMQF